MRGDRELLAILRVQDALLGADVILVIVGSFSFAERRARRDPPAHELVFVGAEVHALPPSMRDAAGRLEQNKLLSGGGGEHAAAAVFFHEASDSRSSGTKPSRLTQSRSDA